MSTASLTAASSCVGKSVWVSLGEAKSILRSMRSRGGDGARIHPYRCIFCGSWHLGHKTRKS